MIRIVIADDHPAFVLGLRLSLSQHDFCVAGTAADGNELIDVVRRTRPDAVVADVRMPRMSGIRACEVLFRTGYEGAFVVLSTYDDEATIQASRTAGARAFIRKDEPVHTIARVVRRLVEEPHVCLIREVRVPRLTPREKQVLEGIASGRSNKQIAAALGIGVETVKDHCRGVYEKLGVVDRLGAATEARRLGIVVDGKLPPDWG